MAKPFDATLKTLLEEEPLDWPALAGRPQESVAVIDADVSTVTAATDKVLKVRASPDWLMHFEFQSGPDATLPRRMHGYNALLEDRHNLLVRSVVVLLRPQAELANVTGVYERQFLDEPAYLTFRYQVIRIWQVPAARLLAGGFGTLPLAPISDVAEAELPAVIARMKERMRGQPKAKAGTLWGMTYILMGLRYAPLLVNKLLEGVIAMEESSTYQLILAKGMTEGALEEARKTLLLLGRKQFGAPGPGIRAAVEGIADRERLEQLQVRLLKVRSWEELLGLPRRATSKRKRKS